MPGTNLRLSRSPRLLKTVTIDAAEVAANVTVEQTFSVKGVRPDMWLQVKGNSLPAGLAVVNAHCETADSLIITLANLTGSPINAASQSFEIVAF